MEFSGQIYATTDAVAATPTLPAVNPPPLPSKSYVGSATYYFVRTPTATPADSVRVEVYACNQPPRSVAEARAGDLMLDVTLDVPPSLLDAGLYYSDAVNVSIPFNFTPRVSQRHITTVTTSQQGGRGTLFMRYEG